MLWYSCGMPLFEQRRKVVLKQIADVFYGYVSRRIFRKDLRILCIMALPGKNGREPLAPCLFHGRQDTQLVVHHDILICRIPLFHIRELELFMNIDEDVVVNGLHQSRALDLARLEDHVTVRENDNGSP